MKKFVVTIAGDSGDGIQLLGNAFSDNVALENLDLNTLPDFPAEIRAPAGTVHGVSGFQIQYGGEKINTAGNKSDVFIAFNAAALKKYFKTLKPTGVLIYDSAGFDAKNCKLAGFDMAELEAIPNKKLEVAFSSMCKEALKEFDIEDKAKDKNKNIFALGFLAFALDTSIEKTKDILKNKFKDTQLEMMEIVLNKGYHYAETIEFALEKLKEKAHFKKGYYRNINGNSAITLAILSAPKIFGRNVFFGGYPITPASDILHELAKQNLEEVIVKQAEDEIAAAGMALGAAYAGNIGVTASSGPGIDLKQEVIGLAHMAEIPLLIIDVQRAGPSTGLPTKVEQSDLNMVLKGRHGDCPVPVVAIRNPSSAFETTLQAIEMMIRFQTPIFLLSDALIANGSELWEIPTIEPRTLDLYKNDQPFNRNEDTLVRPWTKIGQPGINYIAGGLEKDYKTGAISYEGGNHQKMVETRWQKITNISEYIPPCVTEENSAAKGTLILSWGSTYGSVKEAFQALSKEAKDLAHLHIDWIFPFPKNFLSVIHHYDQIIVPELNHGQFADHLATSYKKPIHKINKIQGTPFFEDELIKEINDILKLENN
jgi:2-oxoglutarate ferredoxin oxidoreductase subunit alpha